MLFRSVSQSRYSLSSEYIAICEGELDTIVASAILGIPAVGVPGVQAWKPHFTRMFSGYGRVYIVGDNDIKEDGSNPGAEFSRMVAQEVSNSTIVSLPAGMDLNDLYIESQVEAVANVSYTDLEYEERKSNQTS